MPESASMWSRPRLLVPTTATRTLLAGLEESARIQAGRAANPTPAAATVRMNSLRLEILFMGEEGSGGFIGTCLAGKDEDLDVAEGDLIAVVLEQDVALAQLPEPGPFLELALL